LCIRWINYSILLHSSWDLVSCHTLYSKVRSPSSKADTIFRGGKLIWVDHLWLGLNRSRRNILLSYFVWLGATRTFKLLPHLWKSPEHIIYVPAFIIFGYYFAIMKLYALCTLHEVSFFHLLTTLLIICISQTGWGTRAGIGDAATATAALDRQNNEKDAHVNNPYQRQSHLQQPHYSSNTTADSAFKLPKDLPPSPYHDEPVVNPVYHYTKHSQHPPRNRSLGSRRLTEEGGVELRTSVAR
jgi:hypothetical protein